MNFLDNDKFPKLNFPNYSLKVKQGDSKPYVWDELRHLWLVLTPEEWVRQHAVHFLLGSLGFTAQLLRVEHPARVGTNTNQRVDIVGYNNKLQAQILVECKAVEVKITKQTLAQAVRYNSVVGARYIMLTNGINHFFYEKMPSGEYQPTREMPQINL